MKKLIVIVKNVLIIIVLLAAISPTLEAQASSATVSDIADPDSYTCGQSGYINFELYPDKYNLSAEAINGVQFTTTGGFTWIVSDSDTGLYNAKYPDGAYTMEGANAAWLGEYQGSGRIDFVNGPTSYFSILVSVGSTPVYLDAYDENGVLLATAGPSSININTGHMDELKIVRDSPDMAYVIVHDTGNYFIVDSICTDAPGVPYQQLYDFKQNKNEDGSYVAWAFDHLYDLSTCGTIERYGCALTSVTDIVASFGLTSLPNATTIDPGTVNHYLGLPENIGTHSGCSILWANAGRTLGYTIRDYRPPTTSYDARIDRINEALASNNLVILGFPLGSGKHFIVLYERGPNAPDGSPDYYIVDPYRYSVDKSGMTFNQAYGYTLKQLASSFQIEVVENTAPQSGTSWVIVARSPVEMLITDPNGLQSGFDPITNTYVLNIPGSSYGPEVGISDVTGENPSLPHILYYGQNEYEPGAYRIEVIGTGTGPYTLEIATSNGSMETSLQSINGTTETGLIENYYVIVTEGETLEVQKEVAIDIRPGIFPNIVPQKMKNVSVAVFTTDNFDARTIDPQSVKFGPNGVYAVSYKYRDVDGDKIKDLVLSFVTADTGIYKDDTHACLSGFTNSGLGIQGCDSIEVK